MSSLPNRFNNYVEDSTTNHRSFVQMNNNSNVIRSVFPTYDQTNLFSSSSSFTQNSRVSSLSSFGFNIGSQIRRNFDSNVSSVSNLTPLGDNHHLSQISFTKTVTKRYSVIVPNNTISTFQNDFQNVNMDSRTNIWNSRIQTPTFLDTNSEILNPEPLGVVYPHQESAYRNHSNMFSSLPNRNQYGFPRPEPQSENPNFQPDLDTQYEILNPEPISVVYPNNQESGNMFSFSPNPNQDGPEATRFSEVTTDNSFNSDEYDGRMHSLTRNKHGPYTCPKCHGVFDTSQKFAAHMTSHYKNETKEEKEERLRARNKKRFRKLNGEVRRHESQKKKIKVENGERSGGINVVAPAFKYPVVIKKEQV